MKAITLLIFVVVLCGCSQEVTVVAIDQTDKCAERGERVITTLDGGYVGRFKRCGRWGKVGETFRIQMVQ